ncbi:MAG: DUF5696 domain-containing protein, partial [Deltaproteobacteria bacterium]|nr:DUF5696 domain-containing protein [Deltaproteobacteria bacterium]
MNRSLIFMMSCFAILPLFVNAVEWKVKVNGGEIYYLFQPLTGSLNDLTVRDNKGFSFKPSNYGGITRFVLSGEELRVWEHRHKTTILNESFTNGVYSARVIYEYKGDKLEFLLRLYISDKSLVIEYSEIGSYGKVRQFSFDRSENTPEPRIITLPYGHNVLYTNGEFISAILDIHYSNASQIHTPYYLYSSSSAYFGDHAEYLPCTNGNYNMLKERMIISVSPEISDTFYRPSNPVSAYKDELSNKIVLDFWGDLRSTLSQLKTLANWGYRDILALIHVWQRYGYDNGLPTTYPAGEMYGGGAVMREIIELCHQNNYLFALHTNYVDFYENSDDWNTQDIALNPDGSWVKAWFNPTTNMQSYLIKPTEAKKYAAIYEPLIKDNYLTNAGYLDVHTAIRPSMKVDFDSRITYCSKQFSTLTNYLKLIDYVRSVHKGPIAGEGFGFSAPVWAGYIDAIEADPRSIYDVHKGLGGSDVPLIVDYKLKILHNLFVPHGVGYLPRFFYEQWKDYTKRQIESYRLAEMAFGNAGFMQDPFITYPS